MRDENWCSPLGVAIVGGQLEVVRVLLDKGGDPNAAAILDSSALAIAAENGQIAILQLLLERGAEIDTVHPVSGSALTLAIVAGDEPVVRALLEAGITVDLRNSGGACALHVAALLGRLAFVELLAAYGADIHCITQQGGTPLRSAASAGKLSVVRRLLELGASPSTRDVYERYPIDYAQEIGATHIVAALKKASSAASVERPAQTRSQTASLVSGLPPRTDATIQNVEHVLRNGLTMTRLTSTALEAPTAIAAARCAVGSAFEVDYVVDDPDPRLARREVDFVLWTYEQDGRLTKNATPVSSESSPAIEERIGAIAVFPYNLDVWFRLSRWASKELVDHDSQSILAAMVRPGPAPEYIKPWDWHFRWQVAAALIVASRHQAGRAALQTVLHGPVDWTQTAAIIGLYAAARRKESARGEVVESLLSVAREPPNSPMYQHAIRPSALAVLDLGGVSDDVRAELDDLMTV